MKIILIRHGQPEMDLDQMKRQRISCKDLAKINQQYRLSALDEDSSPPAELIALLIKYKPTNIVSSELLRAQQSAQKLINELKNNNQNKMGSELKLLSASTFNEADLPHLNITRPKLKFFTWCILLRLAWLFGFCTNSESIKSTKKRAQESALYLSELNTKQGSVCLVAHGIINRLIAKDLVKTGWRQIEKQGHGYWSYLVFEKR